MRHSQPLTVKFAAVVVLLTVTFGWETTVGQLTDGTGSASGTAWLVVMSAAATLGGIALLFARRQRRHLAAAVALIVVALSPTGFAYPLNLAVLVLAVTQLAIRPTEPIAASPH